MFDPEQRRTKMAAGWQPYSVKIGDRYYSYERLEPVSMVLGLAADIFEMHEKLEDDDRAKGWLAVTAMFGNIAISKTYLSGLSGAFNALTDPARYGEQFYEQYASSLVPKIVGQSVMMADPHKREVDGVLAAIQSQLPFLREKLMPARDAWGEPRPNQKLFGVLPVQISEESKEKVRTEAMRLELAISPVPKFLLLSGPLDAKERQLSLPPKQRDILAEVSGRHTMSILAPFVNSPDWDHVPDLARKIIIQRAITAGREVGRAKVRENLAAEVAAAQQKIIEEIQRQSVVK
jgi:hypothetical protein